MNRRNALGTIGSAAFSAGLISVTPFGMAGMAMAQDASTGVLEMTLGSDDAPITLIEYASFTCPHCARFHTSVMEPLKAEYVDTGKVKFIYRDVYFDRPGLWASLVARCDPNRFFGIADLLYTDQQKWIGDGNPAQIEQNLRKVGSVAGLTKEQLDTCLTDGENAQALYTWFQENIEKDDVSGTPTLFIDGEKHSNMSFTDLKALLDAKLDA
ncbi:MAG: DsbA family protein [Thalassovita sp.]